MDLKERAGQAKRESKYLDFKEAFDVNSPGEWCELIKDIVAFANSGGGVIVFGVANDGTGVDYDARPLIAYDPAKITDKISKYTGRQFSGFNVTIVERTGGEKVVILVEPVRLPMVFREAGTYRRAEKERIAFRPGTIYFRHGAKSQPADENDLRELVERLVAQQRSEWLDGIQKVTAAPLGSKVVVMPQALAGGESVGEARVVPDAAAPEVRLTDGDARYPFRQKDLVRLLAERLPAGVRFNSWDVQCIKKAFDLESAHPEFVYKPFEFAAPQYSEAVVDWLYERWREDPQFFSELRDRMKRASRA